MIGDVANADGVSDAVGGELVGANFGVAGAEGVGVPRVATSGDLRGDELDAARDAGWLCAWRRCGGEVGGEEEATVREDFAPEPTPLLCGDLVPLGMGDVTPEPGRFGVCKLAVDA